MLFDLHLGAEAVSRRDAADLRFFGVAGALCALAPRPGHPTAAGLRREWEVLSRTVLGRLRRAGFGAFAALAVPPGRIPSRGVEALLAELPDGLSRRGVVAIGPVGPGGGGPREEEILLRQLEMARELRLPVLLAVPPGDGMAGVRRCLDQLRESGVPPERVLVDGAGARAVRLLRAVGTCAVLPLSSGQAAVDTAARLVRTIGPEGIVLASRAGDGGGDLLALPRAADRMRRLGLSEAVIRRACGRNALAVLGLAPADVRAAAAPSARSSRPTSR